MIYVTLPHKDKSYYLYSCRQNQVERYRIKTAQRIVKLLTLQGYTIICPVLQRQGLELPTDWEFWRIHDLALLGQGNKLLVIMLPGWKKSMRIQSEILLTKFLGKKIIYLEPEL